MTSLQDKVLDKSDDSELSMYVMTNVIEPINKSKKELRFIIPNEGILSRDSYLQFEFVGGKDNGFLNIGAGVFSILKNAELRVGSQRIQSNPNLPIWKSITKSYDTPSYRNNYTKYMNGINTTISPCPVGATSATAGNPNAGLLQPTGAIPDPQNMTIQNLPYELTLTTSVETTPVFSIKLSDLFSMFESVELPCFLIKNPIELVLTLNTQDNGLDNISPDGYGSIGCFTGAEGARADANATISLNLDSCLLYSDHLYYSDTRMFQIEESMNDQKGMALLYTDVISVVNSQPKLGSAASATTTNANKRIFQLPVSNYSIKNVFTCWNCPDYSSSDALKNSVGNFSNSLFGKYALLNSPRPYSLQLRINDELFFPQDLVSDSLKFSEAEYVYASPANLACGLYSFNGSNNGTAGYNFQANGSGFFPDPTGGADANYTFWGGINTARNLTGNLHFAAVNVSNIYGDNNNDTILVQQKPIELLVTWYNNEDADLDLNNFSFMEVVKMFSLNAGEVVITDQVRQIQVQ